MSASNEKKQPWLIDLILVLMFFGLGFILYTMIWDGGTGAITRLGNRGSPNFIDGIVRNVGAIGQGLKETFGGLVQRR